MAVGCHIGGGGRGRREGERYDEVKKKIGNRRKRFHAGGGRIAINRAILRIRTARSLVFRGAANAPRQLMDPFSNPLIVRPR